MIFTTTTPKLPKTRLSRPALLVVSVVHIALFWLLLQTAPVQRVVRETVVMLNLPITQPLPKPPPKKVITLPKPPEPIKPIKPIEKPVVVQKTITKPVEPLPVQPPKPVEPPKPLEPPKPVELPKPVEKPVVLPKPPEKVVEVKPVEVVVPKELPKEVVKELPTELPKELPKSALVELPPAPAPATVAPAAVIAMPAPSVPAAPAATAPAAEPAKAAAPAAVASAPAAAPGVPVVAPTSSPTRPISAPSGSNSGGAPAAVPLGAAPQPLSNLLASPLGAGGSPTTSGSPYVSRGRGGWPPGKLQQMSSEQLNPNKRPEKYEDEFKNAGKKDCLKEGSLQVVARLLNGDCPK